MSARVSSFIVVLKEDVSEEYFEKVSQAVRLFDGVIEVKPYLSGDDIVSEITATSREKISWMNKLITLVKEAK